jgi:D-glycero-alpha-D-manno-heptose-7-phosphate kinase
VHARLTAGGGGYRLVAKDLATELLLTRDELGQPGPLPLHRAALRRTDPPPGPCTLTTRSEVPAGSGLGASGALGVALVRVLDARLGVTRSAAAIAEAAFALEAGDAAIAGGRQDQYAAALGGFQLLRFHAGHVEVEPLQLDPGFLSELARATVLCHTGGSRVSSDTIRRVMGAYATGDPGVGAALRAMTGLAREAAAALRAADLPALGRLLSANWREQQRLDAGMRTPAMARIEAAVERTAVLGGKAAGAGAGGCMFFLATDPEATASAARDAGAEILPVQWADQLESVA